MRFASTGILAAAAAALVVAGCDSARPIAQRSDASACARCHGFPPPAPHPQPPQGSECWVCHRTTVSPDWQLGSTHANGEVDVSGHPVPYPAHPVEAVASMAALDGCRVCHGANFDVVWNGKSCNGCHGLMTFADWRTNCTFCHGTRTTTGPTATPEHLWAPPEAVEDGVFEPADRRVGAHQRHLLGGALSDPIACTECHPNRAESDVATDPAHIDGDGVAEVGGTGTLARTGGAASTWDGATCSNYCHGATLPPSDPARAAVAWAPPSTLGCGSCHEANPTTGRHPGAGVAQHNFQCSVCHGGTYTATAADKALHVKGSLDKSALTGWAADRTCTTVCHVNPTVPRSWDAP